MKKKLIIVGVMVAVIIILIINSATKCEHEWTDATCESPKTCSVCDDTSGKELGHEWVDATCIDPKKCSVCEKTEGEALGHSTETGMCNRCNQYSGLWRFDYYVDEFNTPMDIGYIQNNEYITGTFSNSATTDSSLYVVLLIDENDVAIQLYQYGRYEVKGTSYNKQYNVAIKTENGKTYRTKATLYDGGDRLFLKDRDIITYIQNNEKIEVYLEEIPKYGGVPSSYLFTIEQDNFTLAYNEMMK